MKDIASATLKNIKIVHTYFIFITLQLTQTI